MYQSHRAVAQARCELASSLAQLSMGAVARDAAEFLGLDLSNGSALCAAAARRGDPLNPIDIPVVQNIRAGFLYCRQGIAAGALLISFSRFRRDSGVRLYQAAAATRGDGAIMVTQYMLSILLAG